MVLDFKVNKKIGCRDDNQFFFAHMRGMQSLYMYCRCMKGLIFVAI